MSEQTPAGAFKPRQASVINQSVSLLVKDRAGLAWGHQTKPTGKKPLRPGLNRRPPVLQTGALPTELHSENNGQEGSRTLNLLFVGQTLSQLRYPANIDSSGKPIPLGRIDVYRSSLYGLDLSIFDINGIPLISKYRYAPLGDVVQFRRGDLNPQPSGYEPDALPLSYTGDSCLFMQFFPDFRVHFTKDATDE
jgi:hypothetical protein